MGKGEKGGRGQWEVNMDTQYTYMKVIIMKPIILYSDHTLYMLQ